jgi:hypothetical protein
MYILQPQTQYKLQYINYVCRGLCAARNVIAAIKGDCLTIVTSNCINLFFYYYYYYYYYYINYHNSIILNVEIQQQTT